jgi:hypothetical protein
MQHAKSLFDELAAVGRPLSLEDFNLYIFHGLHGEFKDLVTSLVTKAESLSYVDFTTIFLLMSFCIRLLFHHWLQIHLRCPHRLCCPLLTLPSNNTTLILVVIEVVLVTTGAPITTGTTTMTSLIFVVLFPLLPVRILLNYWTKTEQERFCSHRLEAGSLVAT